MLLDPLYYAFIDALCNALAAGIDGDVVRVTDKAHPSLFDFFVQRVEVDVGQQGADRPALWRAFAPFDFAAVGILHGRV
jgi:hypothetical protein